MFWKWHDMMINYDIKRINSLFVTKLKTQKMVTKLFEKEISWHIEGLEPSIAKSSRKFRHWWMFIVWQTNMCQTHSLLIYFYWIFAALFVIHLLILMKVCLKSLHLNELQTFGWHQLLSDFVCPCVAYSCVGRIVLMTEISTCMWNNASHKKFLNY